jgi:hypothetical protein
MGVGTALPAYGLLVIGSGNFAGHLFNLSLGILAERLLACLAASNAKPFRKVGIPPELMFHESSYSTEL